jgi:hypothetical protein
MRLDGEKVLSPEPADRSTGAAGFSTAKGSCSLVSSPLCRKARQLSGSKQEESTTQSNSDMEPSGA